MMVSVLNLFLDLGYKNIQGIEPAKNLSDLANKNNIKTYNGYLNNERNKKYQR